jgi:hypothetical protein
MTPMKPLALVLVLVGVALLLRRLAARSRTQVHRINQ